MTSNSRDDEIGLPWLMLHAFLMPQSHPTTGPVRFLSPVRFLARKAEWSARRNFTVHLWFGRIILRAPWVPRAGPVRASYGSRTKIFDVFISYWTRTGLVRDPQGCRTEALRTRKGIDTTRIGKTPARASYLAVRAPCGPRRGCSRAVYNLETRTGPVSL